MKHGEKKNRKYGGLCTEFLKINNRTKCCNERDDECYMIHYESICYCDISCHNSTNDCCPDMKTACFLTKWLYNFRIDSNLLICTNKNVIKEEDKVY